ncbi:MAG: nitroreductase family deazaflavin-dependent oxidoreductase [Austwickia sp.]|nr:nitroreductase family deazaflavin-dependent oxidoreductase [Actinomycetota bacterium]MCB1251655.1 nitroreductase family deazaflavin-dependent oxidoreductase [Austwickia sp.]MCO5310954.1 nitroreductase family deazaflavin-dependent oxidoreductase [Austwickia sp.]
MPLHGDYATPLPGWQADQLAEIDRTGDTRSVAVLDRPVVVLTIRGAKSGKLLRVPLMRVEHDGRYAAVASKGGAPEHPKWYHSLVANPGIEIQDGRERADYTARELHGAERDAWWDRCVAAFPPYADYQHKTDRSIPVFVCEPT